MKDSVKESNPTHVIKTRKADIFQYDNTIIFIENYKNVHVTLDDAIERSEIIKKSYLIEDGKLSIIADISKVKSVSREVREYYAGKAFKTRYTAVALLTNSSFGNLIGNFYLKVNNPLVPTKLFTSKDLAIEWIKSFSKS